MNTTSFEVFEMAKKAKKIFQSLNVCSTKNKNDLLTEIAQEIRRQTTNITLANEKDQENAQVLVNSGKITPAMFERLVLNQDKIKQLSVYLEQVRNLPDPCGEILYAMELDSELELKRESCPFGVIACIFESRPEVVVQISALSIKSGNAVILKGGKEAEETNKVLFHIIEKCLEKFNLKNAVSLINTREDISHLLEFDQLIDLIIPRGSKDLVKHITENTKIPVMGHADGICHVFIDQAADIQKAIGISLDAKTDYPAVCNAMETLLIHVEIAEEIIPKLFPLFLAKGCEIRGDERVKSISADNNIEILTADHSDWSTEYGDLILSVKIVDSIQNAIEHINTHGSGHTDVIITENEQASKIFGQSIDSACVIINASTRFADGYVFGFGAEVGISTNKIHARGPVGLEGLVTYKYKLWGNGHKISDYKPGKKTFRHNRLI